MGLLDWFSFLRKMPKATKPKKPHADGTLEFLRDLQNAPAIDPTRARPRDQRPTEKKPRPTPPPPEPQGMPEHRPSVAPPQGPAPVAKSEEEAPPPVPWFDYYVCRRCGHRAHYICEPFQRCGSCRMLTFLDGRNKNDPPRDPDAAGEREKDVRTLQDAVKAARALARTPPSHGEDRRCLLMHIRILELELIMAQDILGDHIGRPFRYDKSNFFAEVLDVISFFEIELANVSSTAEERIEGGVMGDRAFYERREYFDTIQYWENVLKHMR